MGCGHSKTGTDNNKTSCLRKFFCCSCCNTGDKNSHETPYRSQHLPEGRDQVPTYDVTGYTRPKLKTESEISPTTLAFMSFAQRNEHLTELDRSVIEHNKTEYPLYYVRMEDEERFSTNYETPQNVRRNEHFPMKIEEEATKL
ncbi:unnamed protein product [Clavelina lepadiformis]|uniref:Uncharacterized protein n=1 Tax=Clavelina lepadiformis TaxID=159417 RepID=A0ABP0H1S8_CLALP